MALPVRSRNARTYVYRKYNRNATDVFKRSILPRAELQLGKVASQIAVYCRRHHTYKNRTGALERSIGFETPERQGQTIRTAVFAGGPSSVQFTYDASRRREKGRRRRNWMYTHGHKVKIGRGSYRWVNYAKFVRDKGFPVLKQGIDHYRKRIAKILNHGLRIRSFR